MRFFSLLIVLTMFLNPVNTKAAPITNFGGVIISIIPCPSSANFVLIILDKRGFTIPLVFQPGFSFLHKMYQARPVVNTIGSFIPGGTCSGIPIIGTIIRMGTSIGIGK